MFGSKTTVTSSFLDCIWPSILTENASESERGDIIKYFIPQRQFDNVWAHELLATKSFVNYEKPFILGTKEENLRETQNEDAMKSEIQQKPYRTPYIMPLDRQIAAINRDKEFRVKLALEFCQHNSPWYIPTTKTQLKVTAELKDLFKDSFEFNILVNLEKLGSRLMIIDLGMKANITQLERWLKFLPYVEIVILIHSSDLYRKIETIGYPFRSVLMEANVNISWKSELNRALRRGVEFARESHIYEYGVFVFIFSSLPTLCITDKFQFLREL
ncbi:uncharacterized protein LOC142234339 [Haematobia irritans]|uniref:uncharacterized protein LOC142234339 n=1 Tax=Haematobia irritans TaxID=7368 RepID=UPI003F4FC82B